MSGDGVAVDGECGNGARLEYCHGCRRLDDGVAVDGAKALPWLLEVRLWGCGRWLVRVLGKSIAMVAGGQVMELR